MRILLCSPTALEPTLGASRALLDLAGAMRRLGCSADLVSIPELGLRVRSTMSSRGEAVRVSALAERLRAFLQAHASDYDVVDYDHGYLPFPRSEFAPATLFVARSALLLHHLEEYAIPRQFGLRPGIGAAFKGRSRYRARQAIIAMAHRSVQEADIVNVNNADARNTLIRCGVPSAKILVMGLGLDEKLASALHALPVEAPARPRVAFVGTFDPRKGSRDFKRIVDGILSRVPEARFRLVGTKGMHAGEREVLRHFARDARRRIDIVPRFRSEELAELLKDCSIGIFPSYLEGFGLGVLEMLAAAVPVVAYDRPGPPMMLTSDFLVPAGDADGMAERVVELLTSPQTLLAARAWARRRSHDFGLTTIARLTIDAYSDALTRLRQTAAWPEVTPG